MSDLLDPSILRSALQEYCDSLPPFFVAAVDGPLIYFADGRVRRLAHSEDAGGAIINYGEEWLDPIRGTQVWIGWQKRQKELTG